MSRKVALRKSDLSAPPPKRGRPKADNPLMNRYPPLEFCDDTDQSVDEQALGKELEKEKPRKNVVTQLLKQTFSSRRRYILTNSSASVMETCNKYQALLLPYGVC